jgi:putative hydrolase of HD superfamily
MDRLAEQLRFALEIDKLKQVLRRTYTGDGDCRRRENTAEHSWHFALMVVLLVEYADAPIDLMKTVKMALVHDIVEVDAGDTYCYDAKGNLDKAGREQQAAERIFSLLPPDQAKELRALWEEFEERQTPESKFANAIDRLQPVLLNYHARGKSWRENGITKAKVIARNEPIGEGSTALWDYVRNLLDAAVREGYLSE